MTPLRQILYAALALVALLAIPALAGARPCADHQAPAVDGAGILHAVLATAGGSSPCSHRDQQPCKSTYGACVATPAAARCASTPFAPSSWASAAFDPVLPGTDPTRLDRPPRR